jgi:hypothetical protein
MEILQETGRGGEGAGEMEPSPLKCKYTKRGGTCRLFYLIFTILGPPPATLFFGIEILQETGRGEAEEGGRREGTVSTQV